MVPKQVNPQDEFLLIFDSLVRQNSSLFVTKTFRGITLTKKIKAILVDKKRVVFQALERDFCAALRGSVHLHNQIFLRPVKARVKDQSISKGLFFLFDFAYIKHEWKNRQYERVQPKDPTYVTMNYQNMAMRASILDISVEMMGVLVGIPEDRKIVFFPNASICSDFNTSSSFGWTKLGGAIHYQHKVTKSVIRLGIRLYPKAEQAHQLQKYIENRETEILDELDQAYISASIPTGVESQYL